MRTGRATGGWTSCFSVWTWRNTARVGRTARPERECVALASSKTVDFRNVIILIALVILLAAGTAYSVYTYLGISFGRTAGPSNDGYGRVLAPGPMVDLGTFTVNLAA